MKMRCECGEIIIDQTEDLPYKAHFIPDQDWFGVLDAIDNIVGAVVTGSMTIHDAEIAVRRVHREKSRTMYQCSKCGRLLVEDAQRNRKMNSYAADIGYRKPTNSEESRSN